MKKSKIIFVIHVLILIALICLLLMACEKTEIQMMEVKRESVQDTTGTTPTIEDFGNGTDHNGWGEL